MHKWEPLIRCQVKLEERIITMSAIRDFPLMHFLLLSTEVFPIGDIRQKTPINMAAIACRRMQSVLQARDNMNKYIVHEADDEMALLYCKKDRP